MPCTEVINAVFGAPAKHPVMIAVARAAVANSKRQLSKWFYWRRGYDLSLTSPPFFTKWIFGTDFRVLGYGTFLPCAFPERYTVCHLLNRSNSDAIAVHEWAKSWG